MWIWCFGLILRASASFSSWSSSPGFEEDEEEEEEGVLKRKCDLDLRIFLRPARESILRRLVMASFGFACEFLGRIGC